MIKFQPKIFFTLVTGVILSLYSGDLTAQVLTAEENYAINRPGIVKVQIEFSATVYVNRVEMNDVVFDRLVDSVKRLDTSGSLMSATQKLDIVLSALNKNPLRYFITTEDYFRQHHRVSASGTGFFITGDGYVVTNYHVIDKDSAFIRRKFLLSTFEAVTSANVNSLQSSWGMYLNDEQRGLLNNTFASLYTALSSPILIDLNKELYVLYRGDSDNGAMNIIKSEAKLVARGASIPGKDVAILKINGDGNLPTLTLSKDSLPPVGTQVLVFGYPDPVSDNAFLAAETGIEPTLTIGVVSAIKKTINNWPTIQVDAMMSHGNSGGPVCNSRGEVVGIITFGSIENSTGGLASGFNFGIPVEVIDEFIDSANIHPQLSKASFLFNEGVNLYYNEFYRRALSRFESIRKMNAGYPQLNFYIGKCKQKIDEGDDKERLFWKYVGVTLIIFIMIGLYVYFKRRNEV